jgi:pilus assembly protein Flp/PilA
MMKFFSSGTLGKLLRLAGREDGQDLVEYGLVVALIVFAATAGMKTIAASVNDVLETVGSTITSASA